MEKSTAQENRDQAYIICDHRRNAPRISVKVCERSCKMKDCCVEYKLYLSPPMAEQAAAIAAEAPGASC